MEDVLQSPVQEVEAQRAVERARARRMSRSYKCRCGTHVFFRNTQCLHCARQLGFLPDDGQLVALESGPRPGTWTVPGRSEILKFCANRNSPAACNWMVYAANPRDLCIGCRLNRTIPNLDDPDNARYWARIEIAKRRLVAQLIALGLPVRSRLHDDPQQGLMFDFLRSPRGGPQVMTGHANGLITINVEEADDARREQIRYAMREPYRTLLGHFRHEVGHYYWDRLVWDTKWLEPFRQLFGDERASYAEALQRNYEQGPPADWAQSYISSYATMHPWEDWAETWAHYLHVVDSLSTARGFGLEPEDIEGDIVPFGGDALYAPDDPNAGRFLELLNGWMEMTMVLNELARSMGQPDFYPFVMSKPAVAKLQFVQMVVFQAHGNADL
ncbi:MULTISPECIES: zinc-binding metallopeptidase family protein [Ramlibacter]|uniref:Zinc-ribbon domain-containing protein n=1 Tax=Ramlibacter pinisoli TaxID=2682844 RepID=A0A6N8IWT6_9BURK|nr:MULTISPECIES: putative zinc-binding metallopeptidase [Ramlibacter]MBA2965480.1 putative zinc-binding metallopeptidase [Ramlibacter sp. CGMCC 1.13660]MVQ30446.1 hypothetical protein [Ramlibacter pinisoli]